MTVLEHQPPQGGEPRRTPVTLRLDTGEPPWVNDPTMAILPEAYARGWTMPVRGETGRHASLLSAADARIGTGGRGKELPFQVLSNGVAVLAVNGPLLQRAVDFWFWTIEGYDRIRDQFLTAMAEDSVTGVLLLVDSPGGHVAGLFEAIRHMRAAKDVAGKPVVAYVDELAASAAYGLASLADRIVVPASGVVGSVGVIGVMAEQTKALEMAGVNVAVVKTGNEKADGHPYVPMTEAAVARFRARLLELDEQFSALVTANRPSLTRAALKALQAGTRMGSAAVDAGLADEMGGMDAALRAVAAGIKQENTMDPKKMVALCVALGVSGSASEDELIAAAEGQRAFIAGARALTHKDALNDVSAVLQATHHAAQEMAAQAEKRGAEVEALRAELAALKVEGLLEHARAEGRLTNPALERAAREFAAANPDGLRAFLGALPAVHTAPEAPPPQHGGSSGLTEAERAVQKQLKLTDEQIIAARVATAV